ncbi:MAG: ankyrin repeat domain-containing protein [Rhodospirillales bacterium]
MTTSRLSAQDFLDAAQRGDAVCVKAGLEQGLKADTSDTYGNTALMMAAARAQLDVCRVLVDAGANPEHRNRYGMGPRNWVRWASNDSAIRKILG